jgi:hypothetical protein
MRFISDDPAARDLSDKGGLKVIAAGLPRCATSSLQSALENDLDFGPCMHMAYVLPHTNLLKRCFEAENETDKAKRQKILHELFDGYAATADFPGMCFADDLMEMYPDAKVILNTRNSAQTWLSSISGTIQFFSQTPYLVTCYLMSTDYWHWKIHQAAKALWKRRFGFGDGKDGILVLETYDAHNNWVREAAKRNGNSILEWQPEQGWEPLCAFLGKPVPEKPFPRLNDVKAIRTIKMILVVRGLLAWTALLSSPALAYWAWLRFLKH